MDLAMGGKLLLVREPDYKEKYKNLEEFFKELVEEDIFDEPHKVMWVVEMFLFHDFEDVNIARCDFENIKNLIGKLLDKYANKLKDCEKDGCPLADLFGRPEGEVCYK
jgi:hypothetical protein